MSSRGSEDVTINPQSRVSVALLGGIFAVLVGSTWSAASWATRIEARLERIEGDLTKRVLDRWTGTDMRHWAGQLKADNPALRVSEPRSDFGFTDFKPDK